MEDDCVIKSIDQLKTIPKEDRPQAMDAGWISKKINDKPAGILKFTWEEAKASNLVSLEQIAYNNWGDKIWAELGAGPINFIGKVKYNVLLKAANKHSNDSMHEIVEKINSAAEYKDCRYTGITS